MSVPSHSETTIIQNNIPTGLNLHTNFTESTDIYAVMHITLFQRNASNLQ